MSVQSTSICFTINNPDVTKRDEFVTKLNTHCKCWVFQYEQGESETPHYQGFFILKIKKTLFWLKRNISETAHFEHALGTRQQNHDYCTKQEGRLDGPWECGNFIISQGYRSDLDQVVEMIQSRKRLYEVATELPKSYLKYNHGIKELKFILDANDKQLRSIQTIVYFGETGTGKTYKAITENPDYFKLDKANNVWFDGYDGQSCLIIDDFYGWLPFGQLLNILDCYPLRLEVKGSFTWAKWTKVIITSNKAVELWYTGEKITINMMNALKRRIHETILFTDVYESNKILI